VHAIVQVDREKVFLLFFSSLSSLLFSFNFIIYYYSIIVYDDYKVGCNGNGADDYMVAIIIVDSESVSLPRHLYSCEYIFSIYMCVCVCVCVCIFLTMTTSILFILFLISYSFILLFSSSSSFIFLFYFRINSSSTNSSNIGSSISISFINSYYCCCCFRCSYCRVNSFIFFLQAFYIIFF
jgi:hypothetical protein